MSAADVLGLSTDVWTAIGSIAAVATVIGGAFKFLPPFLRRRASQEQSSTDPSTTAIERSNRLNEERLELERQRDQRERIAALKEQAPRWEPSEEGEAGFFTSDGSALIGQLRNVGLQIAQVQMARLDLDGQVAPIAVKCDPAHGGGGYIATAAVPPGSVMSMTCDVRGMRLEGTARPSIYMDYTTLGAITGALGVTIPLLRTGEDARGHLQWRLGEPQVAVLP